MGFACFVVRSASRLASVCSGRICRFRSISAVINRPFIARTSSPASPFVSNGFLYTTAIDRISSEQTLLRVIDSEINSALQTNDLDVDKEMNPRASPFEIEDNPGDQTVTLTRKYKGEIVVVVVSMPCIGSDDNDDDGSSKSSVPLIVTVTKKSGLSLEFSCLAFTDEIFIDALSVHQHGNSVEDQTANAGPDFEVLDENLKKTFYKYLEIRGVQANTTNFLHEYMTRKAKREYLLWLKKVKKFMEE